MSEHREYTDFINAYHFVPLSERDPDRRSVLEKGSGKAGFMPAENNEKVYTGKITVQLRTRTALFVPDIQDGQEKDGNGHKIYNFFSYDGGKTPVIPGSSLRGMLRSNYEVLTNSCLSVVDVEDKPIRRTSTPYDSGVLRCCINTESGRREFTLLKAEKAIIDENTRCAFKEGQAKRLSGMVEWSGNGDLSLKEGTRISIQLDESHSSKIQKKVGYMSCIPLGAKKDFKEAWYFKGEPGLKKWKDGKRDRAYAFFNVREGPDFSEQKLHWEENDKSTELLNFLSVLNSYMKLSETKKTKGEHKGYQEYTEQLCKFLAGAGNGECFPVHFSVIAGAMQGKKKKVIYLSPACITKEVSYTEIMDILKVQNSHDTCKDVRNLCPACRLFGMIGKNLQEFEEGTYSNSWASLIRVQDALPIDDKAVEYEGQVVLQESAEPKKSATEFYLKRPKPPKVASWSYDYYACNGKLQLYIPQISGRKYYWHHKEANLIGKLQDGKSVIEQGERNCTVNPVKSKTTFKFPLYFERITEEQLNQLIWICNISALETREGQAKYGYKLGKGKAQGLGSIELTVEDVKIRTLLQETGKLRYLLKNYDEVFNRTYQEIHFEVAPEGEEKSGYAGFSEDIRKAFLRLCDFNAADENPVTYPVSNGQSVKVMKEGFKWFVRNHYEAQKGNQGVAKREDLVFEQYLEPLSAGSAITLHMNDDENNACTGEKSISKQVSMKQQKGNQSNNKRSNSKKNGNGGQRNQEQWKNNTMAIALQRAVMKEKSRK